MRSDDPATPEEARMERLDTEAAARRLRAASGEIADPEAAAEAAARMTYLWAWSTREGSALIGEGLETAIWSFFMEYPQGWLRSATSTRSRRHPGGQRGS